MVFEPPLATRLDDLKSRITAAVNSLEKDTPRSVWDQFNYRLDVRAAVGGHIKHLYNGFQLTLHNCFFVIVSPSFPLKNCSE